MIAREDPTKPVEDAPRAADVERDVHVGARKPGVDPVCMGAGLTYRIRGLGAQPGIEL